MYHVRIIELQLLFWFLLVTFFSCKIRICKAAANRLVLYNVVTLSRELIRRTWRSDIEYSVEEIIKRSSTS